MKTKTSTLCCLGALTGTLISLAPAVQAQNAVAPAVGGRLSVVELRDTSLADALEMIFRAAGNPSHIIDESAQNVPIPSVTLNNITWEAAVRNLANLNDYKVSRNGSGAYVVEPRNPVPVGDGSEGGLPFGPAATEGPRGVPSNPFIGRPRRPRTQAAPSIRTFANSQTRPSRGGRAGGATEGRRYQVIVLQHVYGGGIARLFGAPIVTTENFLNPDLRQNKLLYPRLSINGSGGGGGGGGGGGDLGGGGGGGGDLGGGGGDLGGGGGDLGGGGGDLGGGDGGGGGGLGF